MCIYIQVHLFNPLQVDLLNVLFGLLLLQVPDNALSLSSDSFIQQIFIEVPNVCQACP